MKPFPSSVVMLLVGAGVGVVATFAWQAFQTKPLPPILQGLPHNSSEIEASLGKRLREKYPVGTLQSTLVATLSEQGFVIADRSDGHLWAHFESSAAVCQESYLVTWVVDSEAKLTDINGGFHESCL